MGCRFDNIPVDGNIKARIIQYKVNYLDDKAGNIPTSVLPGRMTVIFADHYALTRIDGFLGQFSLNYIANLRNHTVITMFKIFDKKLVHFGKAGDLPICLKPIESIEIKEKENNISFAGFQCKKLIVSSANQNDFYVICTDQIDVKNPNATTPYKDIDEVLLMFNTRLSLLSMQLIAEKYEEKEVPWNMFHVPDDYRKVSRADLEMVIQTLFN
jgi:hypothetical protein